jgi:YggT family protein
MSFVKVLLLFLLDAYIWIVIIRVLLSWVEAPINPILIKWLNKLTDPFLLPLRKIIPMVRIQGMLLDISPLILIIIIELIKYMLISRI